ncbi:PGC isoform 3, partial [Pan troglodytes]
MKWMVVVLVCLQLSEAAVVKVPLKKFKSIRETMKEKGLLGEFLRTHKYDPAWKYRFGDLSVTYEPMAYMDVQSIQVPNQEFGLSENEPGTNFVYAQFDGIMGLAYPALSVDEATTAMQGMVQEGALTSPVFSVYLSNQQG